MSNYRTLKIENVSKIDMWHNRQIWHIVIRTFGGMSIHTTKIYDEHDTEVSVEQLIVEKIKNHKFVFYIGDDI